MTTRYVDLNASQAVKRNQSNNRYTYKLNKTLELPAGTEISIQNSLINLQGITGQSIELEKDFEETIIYNYYLVDTFYANPIAKLPQADSVNNYRLYNNSGFRFNPKNMADFFMSADVRVGEGGFSENIMPLAGWKKITNSTGTNNYLIPLIGKADIKVPKGIYSVSSLSQLITDQINAVAIPNTNQNFLELQKQNEKFEGMLCNGTTNIIINTPSYDNIDTWGGQIANEPELNNDPPMNQLPGIRALTVNDSNARPGHFAVKPNHMTDLFYQARANVYDATLTLDTAKTRIFKNSLTADPDPNRRYGLVFMKEPEGGVSAGDNVKTYNLFQKGTAVGTTGFEISYKGNGFGISHLHEPRRIPTNDLLGNKLANPSQEAFFMKRVATPDQQSGASRLGNLYDGIPTTENKNSVYNTLSTPAQQYSGILVFNWAYQTALKNANVSLEEVLVKVDANSTNNQEFWGFNEFFRTEAEAEKAWEETLWYRMGFTYDQLQKPSSYRSQNWYGADHSLNGITSYADVDSSALPFMSTIYNNYSRAAETKPDTTNPIDQGVALPGVNAVQLYNLMDSNVPSCPMNNNTKIKNPTNTVSLPINVYSYTGSNYRQAVSIPVQTAGLSIIADQLPRLSINGYMLVLSDIINQDDQAGDQSDVGLLDMLPKSSLSNQDFISDRNLLVHTLSNPKVINYVNINILNPDLTDIDLEPNSTLLIKITTPANKPTVLLANAEVEIAENDVRNQVLLEQQQALKAQQAEKAQQKK
jgi:hypothetical protein